MNKIMFEVVMKFETFKFLIFTFINTIFLIFFEVIIFINLILLFLKNSITISQFMVTFAMYLIPAILGFLMHKEWCRKC